MENILQANNRTLLGRFIQEKVRQYIEPSREGTPRGEPIGFSGVKYGATLYGLTNIKQKEIAERLEISHGLLRKWNTEESFKAMIDKHCREFTEVFMRNMRDRIKRREALNEAFLAQSLQEIASQDLPSFVHSEISDANDYSLKLLKLIYETGDKALEKAISEGDLTMKLEIYATYRAMQFYFGGKGSSQFADNEKRLENMLLNSIVEDGMKTLLKPSLDEEDKKSLLTTMKMVARSLE